MRKLLIITLIALLAGSFVMASDTRVTTMGGVNNIVKDDANIWLYPSTINQYPGLFSTEIMTGNQWMAGANLGFNEDNPWVLGAYFSKLEYSHSIFDAYGSGTNADNRLNLIYGRNFNDMPFGFSLSYFKTGSKVENDVIIGNNERALTKFGLGFGLSPMEGKLDLLLEFTTTSWTDKAYNLTEDAVLDMTKPSGNTEISFLFRYWMDPMGKCMLVPHGGLHLDKQGLELYSDGVLTNTYTNKETRFELGLGMNYEAKEDVLVVTDFGFMIESTSYKNEPEGASAIESKMNTKTIPFFKIGIDAKVFKWMDFRAGVSNDWEGYTSEPSDVMKNSSSTASTMTYLGAGFHWGDFEIDASVNPSFLNNGPDFITGTSTPGWANMVSVLYWFD
ncbi:MAG: hypothetical protein V3V99_14485 [candidate division Zixibacteria bacterium]